MAVLLNEDTAEACQTALEVEQEILISAGTMSEALMVADRRGVGLEMRMLIEDLAMIVVELTSESATRAASAFGQWGKGVHPASLNFGDCFAYELAQARQCPLLFVGQDFSQTDVISALP